MIGTPCTGCTNRFRRYLRTYISILLFSYETSYSGTGRSFTEGMMDSPLWTLDPGPLH